jgi:beta-glucosidase
LSDDQAERAIERALAVVAKWEVWAPARSGLAEATADGVDVRGYLSWTRCGNIEWVSGLELTFGPVAVDPPTFARTVKPPTRWLGEVTRRNALP